MDWPGVTFRVAGGMGRRFSWHALPLLLPLLLLWD